MSNVVWQIQLRKTYTAQSGIVFGKRPMKNLHAEVKPVENRWHKSNSNAFSVPAGADVRAADVTVCQRYGDDNEDNLDAGQMNVALKQWLNLQMHLA